MNTADGVTGAHDRDGRAFGLSGLAHVTRS
jgi:hypothetical protein